MAERRSMAASGEVRSGSRVVLLVSEGPPAVPSAGYVAVPDVAGLPQAKALALLQEHGFEVRVIQDWSYSPSIQAGVVQGQKPDPGAAAPSGSTAVLMVAKGEPESERAVVLLPRVIGRTELEATETVSRATLEPEIVRMPMDAVNSGVVGAQLPDDRTLADAAAIKPRRSWWIWLLVAALVIVAGALLYAALTRPALVPDVVGLTEAQAQAALEDAGLDTGQVTAASSEATPGTVLDQAPVAGAEVSRGSAVDLVVAAGAEMVEVPDVTGLPAERATGNLESAGFTVNVSESYRDTIDAGDVISQTPAAGSQAPRGSAVAIVVSLGPESENVTVPNVAGQSSDAAEAAIQAVGLDSREIREYSDSVAEGLAIGTLPEAGASLAAGTEIALVVSAGPQPPSVETVDVPSVIGQGFNDARDALEALGFTVARIDVFSTTEPSGDVANQYPTAGTAWPQGEDVLLLVSKGPQP